MQQKPYAAHLIAFSWGLADATFFFIVPDVYISYRGLAGARKALSAAVFALGGALIGGTAMYAWAAKSNRALAFVTHIPGITHHMVVTAQADFIHHGVVALMIAPLRGIPYKLYSSVAPMHGVPYISFLAVSLGARLARFLLVGLVVAAISKGLGRWLSMKIRLIIFISAWTVFYLVYFVHVSR